jgi:uncharacterized small protein (DUF1192 family)
VSDLASNHVASLQALTVSTGTLTPAFNTDVLTYSVGVGSEVPNVLLSATASHANAIVAGDGVKTLSEGANVYNISVIAEDRVNSRNYTVNVYRTIGANTALQSLTVSAGTLSFNPATTSYTVNVGNTVTEIDVTGTAAQASAHVAGNVTGKALAVGNNVVTLTVSAESGATQDYTLTIVRAQSNDATLRNIVTGAQSLTFNPAVTYYSLNVGYETEQINVIGIANSPTAVVTGNATNRALTVGNNNITLTVTAENGATQSYTVVVTRTPENTALQDHIAQLQADSIQKKNTIAELGNNITALQAEVAVLQIQRQALQADSIQKTNTIAELNSSSSALQTEIVTLQTQRQKLQADSIQKETTIAELDTIITVLQTEIADLQAQLIECGESSGTSMRSIEASSLEIYPNPTTGEIFIQSERPVEKVEILDIAGRTVETWRTASLLQTINISHLPKGVYLVKIFIDGQSTTKKIIKE